MFLHCLHMQVMWNGLRWKEADKNKNYVNGIKARKPRRINGIKKRRASEIDAAWPNRYTVSCGGPNENTSCHLRFCHTTTHTCFPSHSTGQSNVPCWELSYVLLLLGHLKRSDCWMFWGFLWCLRFSAGLYSVDISESRVRRMTVRSFLTVKTRSRLTKCLVSESHLKACLRIKTWFWVGIV